MDQNQAIANSIDPNDVHDNTRTIYNAGVGEIFAKNFVAGFGRAVGGLFIYVIFMVLAGYVYLSFVYPKIAPMIDQYMKMMQTLTSTTGQGKGPGVVELQELLNQLKR